MAATTASPLGISQQNKDVAPASLAGPACIELMKPPADDDALRLERVNGMTGAVMAQAEPHALKVVAR